MNRLSQRQREIIGDFQDFYDADIVTKLNLDDFYSFVMENDRYVSR